jgi:hypothetical protein
LPNDVGLSSFKKEYRLSAIKDVIVTLRTNLSEKSFMVNLKGGKSHRFYRL